MKKNKKTTKTSLPPTGGVGEGLSLPPHGGSRRGSPKGKAFVVVVTLLGGAIALIGSYFSFRGSLSASKLAMAGAAIMAVGLCKLEQLYE